MGSSYEIKWHGAGVSPEAVRSIVERELATIDATFSCWRDDSELARFNARADTAPVPASDLLRAGLQLALQLAAWTDGAYDPTVAPLSEAFRRQKEGEAVTAAELAAARGGVDFRRLTISDAGVGKAVPEVAIDLDGVVAGLAADRLVPLLRSVGVEGAMLQITGEVLCFGRRPDGALWRIGIVDPERDVPGREGAVLVAPLRERALCTSGDYRNFTIVDGAVRTHVFDPRSGENPDHGVVSVSVLARSCALADGLGTALMVVGHEGAPPVLARAAAGNGGEPLAAWFLVAAPDGALRRVAVGWPEVFALDGRPLFGPALPADVAADRTAQLAVAVAAHERQPDAVDAAVWHGRRLAYLGRYRDAIDVYTQALQRHPDEPHLLRHRGHRWLTVREFDLAVADLEQAATVVRGLPDEVEPDGLPVPGRAPHSTLQFNIHYHLGLAHWCRGDAAAAERAFGDCLATVTNDESRVAITHWLWCALTRLGRDAAAIEALLAPVAGDLDVVENTAYLQLCRLYRGEVDVARLRAGAGTSGAALAYGLANYAVVQGAPGARDQLRAVAAMQPWAAFGVIAAEADTSR